MVRKAAFLFVFMLTALATAAPDIGSEMAINEQIFRTPLAGTNPSVAFDGSTYLVVWSSNGINSDVYGTRISNGGIILDQISFVISAAPRQQINPEVSFDGNNFFVAWADERDAPESYQDWSLYGARVSKDGEVIDENGIKITPYILHPSTGLACDGINCMAVWDIGNGDSGIMGARIESTTGTVVDVDGLKIGNPAIISRQWFPSIAFDGSNYLVTWGDDRDAAWQIYGARVTPDSTVLDPEGIIISPSTQTHYYSALAFDGTNYFVVWADYRNGNNYDIYGARIGTDGILLDPQGIPICEEFENRLDPAITFDGTNHIVVWVKEGVGIGQDDDIFGARVTTEGLLLDQNAIPIDTSSGDQNTPSVATDGSHSLMAWDSVGIAGNFMTKEGELSGESSFLISTMENIQSHPLIASDGTQYLVIWADNKNAHTKDYKNGGYEIWSARIDGQGAVIDPQGTQISADAGFGALNASMSFDGSNFWVAWDGPVSLGTNIWGARVGENGSVLDKEGVLISTFPYNQSGPSINCIEGKCLLTWNRCTENVCQYDIHGNIVDKEATLLYPDGILVNAEEGNQTRPLVASNGNDFFVVWADSRIFQIHGTRVSSNGEILDPDGLALLVDTENSCEKYCSIVSDGTGFLLACAESDKIYALLMDEDGSFLSEHIFLDSGSNDGWTYGAAPSAIFDGKNYMVAWRNIFDDTRYGFYGAYLNNTGTILAPKFKISEEDYAEMSGWSSEPELASIGNQTVMVVYTNSQVYANPRNPIPRIAARIVYSGNLGASCEEKSQCDEGLSCIDDICVKEATPDEPPDEDVFSDSLLVEEDALPIADADILLEEPEEALDADTTNPTDGDKLDADAAHPDNEEPTDDETTDGTVTDNDFPPFDFDFADYGKDDHPACSCSVVF